MEIWETATKKESETIEKNLIEMVRIIARKDRAHLNKRAYASHPRIAQKLLNRTERAYNSPSQLVRYSFGAALFIPEAGTMFPSCNEAEGNSSPLCLILQTASPFVISRSPR